MDVYDVIKWCDNGVTQNFFICFIVPCIIIRCSRLLSIEMPEIFVKLFKVVLACLKIFLKSISGLAAGMWYGIQQHLFPEICSLTFLEKDFIKYFSPNFLIIHHMLKRIYFSIHYCYYNQLFIKLVVLLLWYSSLPLVE